MGSVNAVLKGGHFVYTSGKHGSAYVNKDALFPHPRIMRELASGIAILVNSGLGGIQTVVAPAVGAVVLSQLVAAELTRLNGNEVHSVYAEKMRTTDGFEIGRGFPIFIRDRRVLVVEDIINTGGSVVRVVQAVRNCGGQVLGVAALCNRGNVQASDIGVPQLFSLANVDMDAWEASECPLCRQGIEVNTAVGHGAKFLAGKSS